MCHVCAFLVTPEPTPAKSETKPATRASSKKPKTEVKKDLTSSFEKISTEPKKVSKGSYVANFGFIIALVVAIIAALLFAANKYKLIKFE